MDIKIILRLEEKIDQLLGRKQQLEEDCRRLQLERDTLAQERERIVTELDRILGKLDQLDQAVP